MFLLRMLICCRFQVVEGIQTMKLDCRCLNLRIQRLVLSGYLRSLQSFNSNLCGITLDMSLMYLAQQLLTSFLTLPSAQKSAEQCSLKQFTSTSIGTLNLKYMHY
jgi:hypothetical protein